ncbi:MarR family winged helix-turn-helix transcriptional regulator [Hymenobacter aerilatus]|uniref:MarR family winged helix-turn-helix transcriptional regulator n=1 Tax=Hymenobacter aerilatus TaxID=2932251 RepID=A0A8T9SZW2_9BACT|nr:MarR family winged helix-turn-helix transcriptional regulator [Hymenobacter aerilatus]UOR07415.1 MarR family winged helix-turn-helix transcriptional regulator [Hymenobacter aerilatus]
MSNVFKINTEEWIVRALVSEPVRKSTAAKHGLRPSHLQALMALYSLTQREMIAVTPGELYASTPTSPTLLRSYVWVLVLKGFVQRSRDARGRARLSLTVAGKLLMTEHARKLKRAAERYLAA